MSTWTSRERMLAALNCECPDRTPCSFMMFNALKAQCRTYEEFVERLLYLLRTPGEAVRIGAAGRERVRENYLITRLLRDEMRLLASL